MLNLFQCHEGGKAGFMLNWFQCGATQTAGNYHTGS